MIEINIINIEKENKPHKLLLPSDFFGSIEIKFESGKIVIVRKIESIKLS